MKWPEWATQDEDPLAFLGDDGKQTDAPPPPDMIPKDEPDQNDPESKFVPTSAMGVNLETYFLQDIKDPVTRIQRLENVIMAMHKDMQNILQVSPLRKGDGFATGAPQPLGRDMPTPVFQQALPQESSQNFVPVAPPQGNAAAPQFPPAVQASLEAARASPRPSAPVPSAPVVSVAAGGAVITGLRVGGHPDKTRLVFDVTDKIGFTANLDNNEHLLVVEMPDAQWRAAASSDSFGKTSLIKSYKAEPMDNRGTRVILELKRNTTILSQRLYGAFTGSGQRIVIDLSQ